jgi:hypothetical protein
MLEVAGLKALKCTAEAAEGRLCALELDVPGNRLLRHKDKPSAPGVALFGEVMGLRRQARA